jgi:hypothetical protein
MVESDGGVHNPWMRVLLLAVALLGLLVLAPRDNGEVRGAGAEARTILPRGWAIDRLHGLKGEFRRIDRADAKLTTEAEWNRVSGRAPLPAQPTRAPGSVAAVVDVAALTPVVPPGAEERPVWVVAASGDVRPSFGLSAPQRPFQWGILILDARTGDPLGMSAGAQESWPPYWDRVADRAAGADGMLVPEAGPRVPRDEAERHVGGGAGLVRSWLLPAGAAARAVGLDPLPAWLDPRRDVWLVAMREEHAAAGGEFYVLVDARLGASLVYGQADRIDAPT